MNSVVVPLTKCFWEWRVAYRILVGKPEGNRPPWRHRRWIENNTETTFKERGCLGMDYSSLTQDRDKWRAVVSTVMNLSLIKCRGFCDLLRNCELLKKGFAPWSCFVHWLVGYLLLLVVNRFLKYVYMFVTKNATCGSKLSVRHITLYDTLAWEYSF